MKIIRHKTYKVEFVCGGMQLTKRIKARDAEDAQQRILEEHGGGEPCRIISCEEIDDDDDDDDDE